MRLQFEGWPAIQFAGWPSVAVGTFGGRIAAIDATDDGTGKFRVLVRPGRDDDWPADRFLRQGVRANGWVMLKQVSLGYEIWRQLNGFPPVVSQASRAVRTRRARRRSSCRNDGFEPERNLVCLAAGVRRLGLPADGGPSSGCGGQPLPSCSLAIENRP